MRVRFKLALLLLGALVLAAVLPRAGDFSRTAQAGAGYDKVVDDGGVNCTSSGGATVYMTINTALAAAVDGDAIFVCAGTYLEPELTMSVPNVTLQGAGPNDVTVALADLPNTDVVFTIGAVGVSLMDMTIDAAPTLSTPSSAYAVNILNANDATVSGNVLINAGVISVRISYSNPNPPPTGATISGNDIEADGSAIGNGIACSCNSSSFLGNTFHTNAYPNGILAVDLHGDNLTVSGNDFNGVAVSARGDGNTVMNNSFSGAQPQHADRFQLLVYGLNTAIIGNTFTDSGTLGGGAIEATSVTDINTSVSIAKNIFEGPATTGIRLNENLPDDQFTLTATINGGTPADANVFMNPQNFNQLIQLNNVAANINAENNNWGLCTAPQIEGKIFHGVDNPALGVVDFDPFLTSASCPTPSPTPSPTPTFTLSPTPTPTPSPTATPSGLPSGSPSVTPTPTPGPQRKQGDTDCSGVIDGRDSLILFLFSAGLPLLSRGVDCPDLDQGTPAFGDLNCDGVVDALDGLGPLAFAAGVSFAQEDGCTPLGQTL